MSNLDKKLKSYSLLATGVLAFSAVQGQIKYTNMDPDSVINRNEAMLINMDNAGKAEFTVQNKFVTSSGTSYSSMYNLLMVNPIDSNEFLGIQSIIATSTSSTYLFVPAVMEMDDKIGPNESYWTEGSSYGMLYANVKYANSYGSFSVKAGKWLKREDGYVGVRFMIGGDTNWHYGWIRLSVPNDSTIIVKDFAYESYPGKAINAGATFSNIKDAEKRFKLYAASKNLVVIHDEAESKAIVYNISGQVVANKELNRGQNKINLSHLPAGYYIIKIQYKDGVFTEKVLLK